MAKITAPNEEFNCEIGGVQFEDGKAETDNQAVISYCRNAGYTVDGDTKAAAPEPESPDPRNLPEPEASTLRDAAVDPKPEDFLAPTNAGEANPHGPEVISPEIHASEGVRPVKGGDVHVENTNTQDAEEKAHAAQESFEADKPAGNASKEEWHAYATAQGKTEAELDGLGRDGIRELFN
ncbi:hypothetical protein QE394_001105 [Arthrobacter sp. SORGH_AS 212]|uniref:hypothetical protein n=1 Tax=Pseudarthrobacter sp. SORGH_AS 212 TaxID=3041777 RepID=UPI002788543E|nr:hypothetical protein [Arthrobacter sp. SORGH_AS_0212]